MLEINIGDKFNYLTVLELPVRVRNEKQCTCQCKCGNIASVGIHKLIRGDTKSCGCFRRQSIAQIAHNNKKYTTTRAIAKVMAAYKFRAKKYNRVFELTENEFVTLITGNCFYCGDTPKRASMSTSELSMSSILYNGIDRISSAGGYSIDNCVTCCKECNRAKDVMTPDQFIGLCRRVVEKHHD